MFDRGGQVGRSSIESILPVFLFLISHLLDDCTALRILGRQAVEVAVKVRTHLPFRFCNKPEAPLVPEKATRRPYGIGTGVPERAEFADIFPELVKTLLAPGEMIELLVRGPLHLLFNVLVAGDRRVSLVQRLRCNLPGVIDAHQASGMPFLSFVEVRIDDIGGGGFPGRVPGRGGDRSQRVIGAREQSV